MSDGDHHGGSDDHLLLAEANVTFSSMLARNLDGQLIDVEIDLPVTVDVLGMRGGDSLELPTGVLPPGIYDQIVVVMTQVELVTQNGTSIAITPPGGGWTSIVRVCPFEVAARSTTMVQIRFWPRSSFGHDAMGWHFTPDMECDDGPGIAQPQ